LLFGTHVNPVLGFTLPPINADGDARNEYAWTSSTVLLMYPESEIVSNSLYQIRIEFILKSILFNFNIKI